MGHLSDYSCSEPFIHHEHVPHRYAFSNTNKLDSVYNAKNRSWQGIHNAAITEKNREPFKTDLIVQGSCTID